MKREILNECRLSFPSLSVNESYARAAAAAFAAQADPTVREISEIKTAVSEAVTSHRARDTAARRHGGADNAAVPGRGVLHMRKG